IGDPERRLLQISKQFPTRSQDGPQATIGDITNQIVVESQSLGLATENLSQVSLATPGPATIDGVLLSTPNLDARQWNRCPIREMLQQSVRTMSPDASVQYVGDGQAAALGEFAIRTGAIVWEQRPESCDKTVILDGGSDGMPAVRSLFMVAVGTGLGGGEVRDGATIRGTKGRAGHVGHLMLPVDAFRYEYDRSLKVGNALNTAESAVSLTSLTHQLGYRLTLEQWRDHQLNQVDGTVRDKAKQLRELAAADDPLAVQLFDDQASALGITLLMVNYIGDYDLLVIGGGVCDLSAEMRDRYLQMVERAYHQHALDGFRELPPISFSVCGDHASVIGALFDAYGSVH
ncbi:MAG: ROK family protein, partial [Pirellulaceae bacterium]|nr:ROK family protein [Pirellulaceae bacterium]